MLNRDYRHEMKPAIGAFGHSYHAFLHSKRSGWRWTVVLSVLFAALLYSVGVAMAQGSPPEIPDAPTSTAIFLGGVDLEWNEVANAESYDLQWYDVGTGEWFDLPEGNIEVALYGAGAVVSGLDQNNSYFWVRASNENGSSDWSDYVGVPPTEQEPPLGRKRKPDNETPTGAPTIVGEAIGGSTLTADISAIQDENGLARVKFYYQWLSSDGGTITDLQGATESRYTLKLADEGRTVSVRVSFTDRHGYAESLESVPTAPVVGVANSPASGLPIISGTAEVSSQLAADISGISDADGLANATLSYQWIANDGTADTEIAGATSSTYTLALDDVGNTIAVRVRFTDDYGFEETLTSEPTAAVIVRISSPASGLPIINGTAEVSNTLTADISEILDADGLVNATFSYQWIANAGTAETEIAGATSSTYTLTLDDVGNTIAVRVRFTDDYGFEETLTSEPTAVVIARRNSPASGLPTISGTAEVSNTLTADISEILDADGLVNATFSYQWIANAVTAETEITGATSFTYTLSADDEGKTVAVRVSFIDDWGNYEELASEPTDTVAMPRLTLMTAIVNAATLVLSYGEVLDASVTLPVSAFTVTVNGNDRPFDSVSVAGSTVTLVLASAVKANQTVEVSYTRPLGPYHIRGTAGRVEYSFRGQDVSNETPEPLVPKAPQGLTATAFEDGTISLDWDDPGDPTITGYQILRRAPAVDAPGLFPILVDDTGSAATSFEDTSTTSGIAHIYRIKARNADGLSKMSNSVRVDALQYTTLVSNANQNPALTTELPISGSDNSHGHMQTFIQGFSTGNLDAMIEYITLHRLTDVETGSELSVGIYEEAGNTVPGGRLQTLTSPESLRSNQDATFTALAGSPIRLSANTPYFVMVDHVSGSVYLSATKADGEDSDSDPGWLLRNFCLSKVSYDSADSAYSRCFFLKALRISIHGFEESLGLPLLSVSDAEATEGSAVEFTVALSKVAADAVTVQYNTSDGTATSDVNGTDGQDYTPAAGQTLTIAPGETEGTISISTGDDTVDEGDETFTLTLSDPSEYAELGSSVTATGTIINDDQTELTGATLSSLSLTDNGASLGLTPPFGPLVRNYRASVPNNVKSVTLTATKTNNDATLSFIGSDEIRQTDNAMEADYILEVGENPVTITVTSADGSRVKTYTVNVTRAGSKDATLSAFDLSDAGGAGIDLTPAFDPATLVYTVTVPSLVDSVTLTTAKNHAGASVVVLTKSGASAPDEATFDLPFGSTLIKAMVTAEYGKPEKPVLIYMVTVTRAGSNDATLSAFDLSDAGGAGIDLTPAFDPATLVYTVTVPSLLDSVTLSTAKSHAGASVVVLTEPGTTSAPDEATADLAFGSTLIKAMVTSEDGSTTLIYMVTVTRAGPPLTASFASLPASHQGSGTFELRVEFDNPLRTGAADTLEQAFQVTNGEVRGVTRVSGLTEQWEIEIEPLSDADVVVVLPASADCAVPEAVCTAGNQPLSTRLEATISFSAQLPLPVVSIAALASAVPENQWAWFRISRTGPTMEDLVVDTRQTFTLGADSEVESMQWRLRAGRNQRTVGTLVAGDDIVKGDLTITVTLEPGEGYLVAADANFASVVVEEDDVESAVQKQTANTSATGKPTISGTVQVEETLTASTSDIADDDGLTDVSYSYQWVRKNGSTDTDIQDATGASYTLVAADEGQTIKVRVSFTDNAGNEETLTSAATAEVAAAVPTDPPGAPRNLRGAANADGTVTLSWDAPDDDTVTGYQILRRRPTEGENTLLVHVNDTGSTVTKYTDHDVTPDVRHTYRVKAINAVGLGKQSKFVSVTPTQPAEPSQNSPATGRPTIGDTAQVEETLTASTSDIADDDGLTDVSYSYQWVRKNGSTDTDIQDATGASYTLVAADEGQTIKVRVSFTDNAGNEETLTSAATAEVAAGAPTDPPGAPRNLRGAANADGTVTLSWDAPDDDTVTGYQILRRRPTEGENTLLVHVNDTGSTVTKYTDHDVTPDVRHTYRVKAINAVGLGKQSKFVSVTPTQPAEPSQNSPATGRPTIGDTAQVGEELTASTSGIADADGLTNVSYSYQWIRSDGSTDTDIQAATGSTHTLVDADEGKTIKVKVISPTTLTTRSP